jgi:hypothetical protein
MILHFEDCIDVVWTLLPEFGHVFLFYHSCFHDQQGPEGLKSKQGIWRGATRNVTPKIEENDVNNFGINASVLTLKLGDVQSMQFLPPDVGPCWMSPTQ